MRLVQSISNIDLIYQEHDLSMVSFQIESEKHNSSQTNVTKFICKDKGNSFLSYWKYVYDTYRLYLKELIS